jgi:hypothetical protein
VVHDSFLSRRRFLGLSEFGLQSIIYHEGSTYRVKRSILTIRAERLKPNGTCVDVIFRLGHTRT